MINPFNESLTAEETLRKHLLHKKTNACSLNGGNGLCIGRKRNIADSLNYLFSKAALSCLLITFLMTAPAQARQITLAWDPPAANEDGSALSDLAGYIVYYGPGPDNYVQGYDVGNVLTYTFDDLVIGQTYYFAVTSYDSAGNKSRYSAETSMTISQPSNVPPVISSLSRKRNSKLYYTFSIRADAPDSHVTTYKWDVNGDGRYDKTTTTGRLSYKYKHKGTYRIKVKIINNEGKAATVSYTTNVY